ncbi:MAG: DUF2167 domain-containing protein [Holophagales bacterium]|nr:DUF2167 domain-containing protein [Holophagales bacterium]
MTETRRGTMLASSASRRAVRCLLVLSLAVSASTSLAETEGPKIDWKQGPSTADLGGKVAELKVPEKFVFAGAEDTKRLMESFGNPADGTEVGFLAPADENESWFVVFEYHDVGFIKDADKEKIDADALLASIREGTEEANKVRKEKGMGTISVVGWAEPPRYDTVSHNLVWAIRGRGSDGHEVVNYNSRILGREGYTSATLVTDPETLATLKPQLAGILGGFSYKSGRRYSEWVAGDKVAAYGLTALVAGGAGAAAAKLGLFGVLGKFLAKGWKLVAAAVVALGAGAKKLFGGKSEPGTPA